MLLESHIINADMTITGKNLFENDAEIYEKGSSMSRIIGIIGIIGGIIG